MRPLMLTSILLALAGVAAAQDTAVRPDPENPVGENLQVPPDWHVRLDAPDPAVTIGADAATADIRFVAMTPGWHITTGPRAIFWHPGSTTAGDFRAEAQIHLFPPGEHNEAYGLFFGGSGLDGDAPTYDYFVLRRSGEFLIKRRRGDATEVIRDWTPHDAIVPYSAETEGTATNTLAIVALGSRVSFEVNGVTVAELSRDDVATEGLLGLRVNHHLNLHVSTLSVESLSER
jgi:hypothetical protein